MLTNQSYINKVPKKSLNSSGFSSAYHTTDADIDISNNIDVLRLIDFSKIVFGFF